MTFCKTSASMQLLPFLNNPHRYFNIYADTLSVPTTTLRLIFHQFSGTLAYVTYVTYFSYIL